MSGFEIAGVVLGSIPLIISALDHYAEGVAVMKNMKEYECVFSDIQTSFVASVAIFQNSCYQLLGPLNLSDQQMSDLLLQRSTEAWEAPSLQNDLEKRLGPHYKIYSSLVGKLNRRILLFCKKLKLNDDLKPPWINQNGTIDENARKKFFKNVWTRINGGFNSNKYAELLQAIDNDIAKISQLTARGLELEPLRVERLNQIRSMYWKNIRDQAQRLFESLNSRFDTCSCHNPHKATLRLDARKNDSGETAIRFAFLLTFEKSEGCTGELPWNWRDIEIEASPCTSAPQTSNSSQSVRLMTTTAAPALPSVLVSSALSTTATTYVRSGLASKIDNLCRALVRGHNSECCIGFLEDQSWQHHVYCVPGPGSSNQISDIAPIKEVIYDNNSRVTTIDKYTLAYTLATAVLQLYDTPWLPTAWSSNDIFILKNSSGNTLGSQFYASRTFGSPSAQAAIAKTRRCVKNEMVFALGVALLELSYGQPLLSLQTSDDLNDQGVEDSMTEFSIATRLADRIHEREMENYAKAVLRCIRCSFDTFSYDFEDRAFREKFLNGVVTPLRADYEYVTGGRL
ncbi:hypothetical protein K402DRAFT_454804 [Aulographum hederae CBS 113979]|uniref:DUF7580 domain-containing protein n=1 Tax=Aulographum hederae CBS 113979 TaxID=1176131 RepID=A0A6G1GYI1_9PEZI|nr:hypothetical protein K402DRAFT_454804 [Aulographum hederae CBS 113979]